MIAMFRKLVEAFNQVPGRKRNSVAVFWIGHDANHPVLRQRTTGPAIFRICLPPAMSAFMKDVIGIKQSNQDIDIQQRAHSLNMFLIHQILDMLHCDHFAARRQNRNAPPDIPGWLGLFRSRRQAPAGQGRNHTPSRTPLLLGQFLGCLQHIIFNIQGRPHAMMLPHHRIKVNPGRIRFVLRVPDRRSNKSTSLIFVRVKIRMTKFVPADEILFDRQRTSAYISIRRPNPTAGHDTPCNPVSSVKHLYEAQEKIS